MRRCACLVICLTIMVIGPQYAIAHTDVQEKEKITSIGDSNRPTQPVRCPPGYGYDFTDLLEPCKICVAGEYSNPRSNLCLSCPAGTYSAVEGSSQCTPCPVNTATAAEGSTACTPCGHPAFSTLYCDDPTSIYPSVGPTYAPIFIDMACPTQGYGLQYNSNNVQECLPCPIGRANNNNYQGRYCRPCPTRTFAAQIGTVTCTPCPADSISVPTEGTYCQPCGHTPYSDYQCEPPIGSPTLMPMFIETPCSIQGYGLQYVNGVHLCLPCPVGYANNNNMEGRRCHRCLSNTIAPVEGTVFCSPCPLGATSNDAGTYCTTSTPTAPPTKPPMIAPTSAPLFIETPCPIQGYGLQYVNGVNVCLPCPVGYANNNNMEGRYCHRCLSNTIAPVEGTVFCSPCPLGATSNDAGTYCTTSTPTAPPTKPPTKPPVKAPTSKPSRRSRPPVRTATYRPSNARPSMEPTIRKPIRPYPLYSPNEVAYYK